MKNQKQSKLLSYLLIIVTINYLAQIPYYFHQYYAPYRTPPSLVGSLLLLATLAWFLSAFRLLTKGSKVGWWLMFGYLLIVFLFYAQTQIVQFETKRQLLLYVYHPESLLLFTVFGIGYVNCLAAAFYMVYIVARRKAILSGRPES